MFEAGCLPEKAASCPDFLPTFQAIAACLPQLSAAGRLSWLPPVRVLATAGSARLLNDVRSVSA
jgi:hypothetical protein